jgi:hypothetical protein
MNQDQFILQLLGDVMNRTQIFRRGATGLLLCSAATYCFAQANTAEITGTVSDVSGAVIPGATVQIVETDTQAKRTVQTSGVGAYVVTQLQPGHYEVLFAKAGFAKQTQTSINLQVDQILTINPKLAPGTNSQTVQVRAGAELLNASSSEIGTVIGGKAVNDLPLNGRNFTQLLTLVPGATPISTSQGANQGTDDGSTVAIPGTSFSNPSLNGQQNRETLYLLDGVVNTDFRTTTYTVLPIADGISQFKVETHDDDPAFGSVVGGVVNVVTTSGTNHLHGDAWEYIRNNAFDARNPFTDVAADGSAAPAAAFHQNEFGGTIGGPVWFPKLYDGKNRTFFFFGYEGWRYSRPSNGLSTVPTQAELNGDFSASVGNRAIFNPTTTVVNPAGTGYTRQPFANGMIPAGLIDTRIQKYLETYFPKPNYSGDSIYNEILRSPVTNNSNNYQGRIDQKLTDRDSVFFRWSNQFVVENNPATNLTTNLQDFNGLNIGAGITHIFGPKLVLNVYGGRASRGFSFDNITSPGLGEQSTLGFAGLSTYGPLVINLADPYGGSGLASTALRRNSSWSVGSDLSWQLGKHSLSFGEQVIDQYRSQSGTGQGLNFGNQQTADPNNQGTTGNSLASALLGYPAGGAFQGNNFIKYSIPTYAVYAGDSWKVTPKLTLNLGLRYDHLNQPDLTAGVNNGFNFSTGNWELGGGVLPPACIVAGKAPCIPGTSMDAATDLAATIGYDGSVAGSHIIVAKDPTRAPATVNWDVGPRFGFAYQAKENTVVSGGFGIVYDTLNGISQTFSNSIGSWPNEGSATPAYNTLGTGLITEADALATVASPLTTGGPFSNFNYYYSPNLKPLYSEDYNMQVQQTIAGNILFQIAYVGSVSKRLDYGGTANGAVTPGAGTITQVNARRPYPYMTEFNYDSSVGAGSYNSMQIKLQRRFQNGLEFLGAYTWSKSIDTGTSGRFGAENGAGGGSAVQDYYLPKSNRSVSAYDVPQFASISVLYALPVGRGQRYLNHGPASYVLGNWQLNTVAQLGSGQVYTLQVPGDPANIGYTGYGRPNLVGNPNPAHKTAKEYFNPAAFSVPVLSFGDVGRDSMRSAAKYDDDLSLFKTFPVKQGLNVEFRAEAFNVFNLINYGVPDSNLADRTAGVVNSVATSPRELQFALKVHF